jgi:hypothetical protein
VGSLNSQTSTSDSKKRFKLDRDYSLEMAFRVAAAVTGSFPKIETN